MEESNEFYHWIDTLYWCPSQCYYFFKDKDNKIFCIYLRWRHHDPWSVELVPCDEDLEFDWYSDWEIIDLGKEYRDFELEDLKVAAIEEIRKKFPDISFPE